MKGEPLLGPGKNQHVATEESVPFSSHFPIDQNELRTDRLFNFAPREMM